MATIDQVLSVLLQSKKIMELPPASDIPSTGWMIFYNPATLQVERVQIGQLSAFGNWLFIDGSFVEKAGGNTDTTALESGDTVWFKPITNGATLNETLVGHTYDGGDTDLNGSYTQNQTITT